MQFDPFCFCLFWWKISRYFKAVGRFWQSKNTISFLYTIPCCTEEQQYIILLWPTILGNCTFHWQLSILVSKIPLSFVAEFNSNLKISEWVRAPPLPLPLLRACWTSIHQNITAAVQLLQIFKQNHNHFAAKHTQWHFQWCNRGRRRDSNNWTRGSERTTEMKVRDVLCRLTHVLKYMGDYMAYWHELYTAIWKGQGINLVPRVLSLLRERSLATRLQKIGIAWHIANQIAIRLGEISKQTS